MLTQDRSRLKLRYLTPKLKTEFQNFTHYVKHGKNKMAPGKISTSSDGGFEATQTGGRQCRMIC